MEFRRFATGAFDGSGILRDMRLYEFGLAQFIDDSSLEIVISAIEGIVEIGSRFGNELAEKTHEYEDKKINRLLKNIGKLEPVLDRAQELNSGIKDHLVDVSERLLAHNAFKHEELALPPNWLSIALSTVDVLTAETYYEIANNLSTARMLAGINRESTVEHFWERDEYSEHSWETDAAFFGQKALSRALAIYESDELRTNWNVNAINKSRWVLFLELPPTTTVEDRIIRIYEQMIFDAPTWFNSFSGADSVVEEWKSSVARLKHAREERRKAQSEALTLEYWRAHASEKLQLEAAMSQIETLSKEIASENERLLGLGLLRFKEKAAIREKILKLQDRKDESRAVFESINAEMQKALGFKNEV